MFDVLQVPPAAALEGVSGGAPQTDDKLWDFTVGLKIRDEASSTAVLD